MVHQKTGADPKRVLDRLRRAIVRGEIPPGSRIVERDVAAELAVSRTPVREALARLQSDGLLRAVAGRQRNLLEVARLTAGELQQVSAATAALEGIGAAVATSQPEATRLDLADRLDGVLESVVAQMNPDGGSFARALKLDERFHRMLADDFLEPSVAACLESARTHVYRYVWMFVPKTGVTTARFEAEHAPIVAALRAGDASAACDAIRANWTGFAARIRPFLEEV